MKLQFRRDPRCSVGTFWNSQFICAGKKGRKKGPINSVGLSRRALLEFRAELTDIVRIEIRVVGERKECR